MRNIFIAVVGALVAGCGSGDSITRDAPLACSNDGQKQFVLDAMYDWYLWNDLLPAQVNIADHASPEALLAFLTSFQPLDNFSFIGSAAADQQFFGEGKFEGFGFSLRFLAAADLRLTRVFSDSPAAAAGLARGQRILELNGRTIAEIEAAEGVGAVLDTTPVDFLMRNIDGSEFAVTIAQDIVTIDPVPQSRLIPVEGAPPIGYFELATFISTADPVLDTVFADYVTNGVTDVIIDLRYNGGGLVSTAELLGDLLGGAVAFDMVFSDTRFNADRANEDTIRKFRDLASSMGLSSLVVIATPGTASASELIINGMEPHVNVTIVGDTTFGKPVGQVGFVFCEKILRPTAFQTFNALGFGDYFDGLPADCAAADDLNVAVGADTDPNMVAALGYLATGACPITVLPGAQFKVTEMIDVPQLDRRGRPSREFADAF